MKLSQYRFIMLFVLCLLFLIPATVSASKHIIIYPEPPEPFKGYGWDTNLVGYRNSFSGPNYSFFDIGGEIGRDTGTTGDFIERMFTTSNLTDLNVINSNVVGINLSGKFETFSEPVTIQIYDADWGELLTRNDWNSYQSLLGQKTFSAHYSDYSSVSLGNSLLGKNAQILIKSGYESSGYMGLSDLRLDIEVKYPPTADFETVPPSGMSPLKVRFIDTSIVDGRRVGLEDLISTVWQYKRSDGAWTTFTPDEQSCFVFTDPGNYDIKIIENAIDGSDSVTKSISVTPMIPLVIDGDIGKIAFVSDRDGINEIFVMNSDGSGQTNLHIVGTSPAWSPDGAKIAFVSDSDSNGYNRICMVNADGSEQICLTPFETVYDQHGPIWSPDGTKIAYVGVGMNVYVMNADGSGKTQIRHGYNPAWSPDSTKIALGSPGIWVVDANGMNPIRLTPFNTYSKEVLPTWSPDSPKIAFMRYYLPRPGLPPELPSEIFAINADGSGETNLTKTPTADESSPKWSPDGTKIAYTSDIFNMYVMNADGSEKTFLTSATEKDDFSWSHDSTKIAFTTTPMNINKEIYVVNAGGPELIQLTFEGNNYQPAWGPGSVSAPEVSGMMPSDGFAESGEHTYTVEGSGFQSGDTVSLEKEGATPVFGTNVEFNSESVLFVNFSFITDNVGIYDIVVRNPDMGVGRLDGGFRVRPVPVVLVHGWRGAPSVWNILKADLQTKGYSEDDILVFNYEPGLEEPIGYATNLAAAISNWRANNDDYDGKIDIICHSYGAIVSRWYMEQMTDGNGKLNGEKVRLWVGLAPVNQGAAIADIQPTITPFVWLNRLFNVHFFGIEPAITHMKTNSATIKTLNLPSPSGKSHYPIPGVTYKVIVGYNAATTPEQRVQYPSLGGYTLEKKANGFYRFTQLGDGVVANAQSRLSGAGIDYMPGLTHTNIHNNEDVCAKVIVYLKNPAESSSNAIPTITNERDQNLNPLLSLGNHGNFVGGWMYPIKVDSSVGEMVMVAAGEMTSPNTKLYNPDGIQVTSGSNTEITVNAIGEYYDILSPQTGSWSLQSYGTTDIIDRLVFVDSSIQLDSSGGIEDISLGHSVKVAATFNQNGVTSLYILQSGKTDSVQRGEASAAGVTVGWNVTAMIQPPDMTIVPLTLYDDGLHSDGAANDGEYANIYVPSHLGLYSVETIAQSISDPMLERSTLASFSVTGPNVIQIPGGAGIPTDPDSDGLYEDLNANGFADWDDAVVLFWNTDWIQDNEPVSAFDFNGNGFIDWDDAVVLFWEV